MSERKGNGQKGEKMILPRVFVFSMSRPTIRPTLSIFDLLCAITGCGATPRNCVWQGGGVSRRLDKRDAGHLRKEMFPAPVHQRYQPHEDDLALPFKVPLSIPRSKSPNKGPYRFAEGTRSTTFGKALKSVHRREQGGASESPGKSVVLFHDS